MNATASVAAAAVSVFVLSSVYYVALTPIKARVLGHAAPDRGGRPAGIKVVLELARSLLLGAVVAGVARAPACTRSAPQCSLAWCFGSDFRSCCSPGRCCGRTSPPSPRCCTQATGS